eukprot:1760858-Amphidinium_carterae.1
MQRRSPRCTARLLRLKCTSMDEWVLYQITGDAAYLQTWRRKKAVRTAAMSGSLGSLLVFTTSFAAANASSCPWPPPWLPRRCVAAGAFFGALGAASSWSNTAAMVDNFVFNSSEEPGAELASKPRQTV